MKISPELEKELGAFVDSLPRWKPLKIKYKPKPEKQSRPAPTMDSDDSSVRKTKCKRQQSITRGEYWSMIEKQNFACAICKVQFEFNREPGADFKRNPCLDHNHSTGQNRSILCVMCNSAIGYAREDVDVLIAMIEYVKKWNRVEVSCGDEPDWS